MRDLWLKLAVGVAVALSVGWFLVAQAPDFGGKRAQDEEIIVEHEKDARTGEYFRVQTIKCNRCGQTISRIRLDRRGLPVGGHSRPGHECDKVWQKPKYTGAGFSKRRTLAQWLDDWQRRLSGH